MIFFTDAFMAASFFNDKTSFVTAFFSKVNEKSRNDFDVIDIYIKS